MRSGARAVGWGGVLALGLGWAAMSCRASPKSSPPLSSGDSEPVQSVGRQPLEGWGLVGIPREGGSAVYYSRLDIDPPAWSSATQLPPASDILGLPQRAILIDRKGEVYAYLPTVDRLDRLGRLRPTGARADADAVWTVDRERRQLVVIARDGEWRTTVSGQPVWADRAAGGRWVVLSRREGGESEIGLYAPPGRDPVRRVAVRETGEPVVTAWGALLYVPTAEPNGPPGLLVLTATELSETGRIALPGEVRALAATPSAHRLYAADADAQLHVIDRVRGKRMRTVALPGAVDRLRFSPTGEVLFARRTGEDSVIVIQAGVDRVLGSLASAWDPNLPWATPGGAAIVVRDRDRLRLIDGSSLDLVAEMADAGRHAWWPVAWTPSARPATTVAENAPPPPPAGGDDRSPAALPQMFARPQATVQILPRHGAGAEGPGPGVYAVVGAARTPDGIWRLRSELASEGYPAAVDRYVDEVGTEWYRAMLGPYRDRPTAEAAAQRIATARGVRPWILELRLEPDAELP